MRDPHQPEHVIGKKPGERLLGVLDQPYSLLMSLSLALALSAGFGLGLYLLLSIAFRLPLPATTPALMQVHGQAEALGFVMLFIMAVGVQIIPRFHSSTLDRPRLVSVGGLMLASGVTIRALAQPIPASTSRSVGLILAAILTLIGALPVVYAFSRVVRHSVQPGPRERRALLPATMGSSLLLALLLNVFVSIRMVVNGGVVVPLYLDEALVHLELWGFATTMVFAVAGNIYPRFLLLRPTRESALFPALLLWALGSLGTPVAWLVTEGLPAVRVITAIAQLAGIIGYLYALRLYEPTARASTAPHVTDTTRTWARVAFGFLIVAASVNVAAAALTLSGSDTTASVLSAARHALAQGFLLPIIVLTAARILPGYSGQMMRQPRVLTGLLWTLFVGAALRSAAQLLGGYEGGWAMLMAAGATLSTGAFTVFAIGLWQSSLHHRELLPRPGLSSAPGT
jgi:hypothetical protein